ncbi:MAG: MarR family winged helix-turn-helix transcriptional regulator [Clostridium sp.]
MNEEYLKLENQLCFSTYALSRALIKKYRPYLDEVNLTYPQYIVLLVMWEKTSISMKDLGEKLLLDSGTLTPLIKKLENMNLIIRKRSTLDERLLLITLTKEGQGFKEKVKDIPFKVFNTINSPMDDLIDLKAKSDNLLTLLTK